MSDSNELIKIFQKNLLYFQTYYPDLYKKLSQHNINEKYELIIDKNGYFNIEIKTNNTTIFTDNPEIIAQEQVNTTLKENSQTNKAIFIGSLLGFQIEKFILQTNLSVVMVIEPDLEMFKLSTFLIDYETLTKDKVTIFSISDDETTLKNKILDFIFTMFYNNNNISFLKTLNSYEVLFDYIHQVYQENIFYNLDTTLIKIPKFNPHLNLNQTIDKANHLYSKEKYSQAMLLYLQIIAYEQVLKKNNSSKNQQMVLLAYLNLGNIFYTRHDTAEAFHCYGKCIYTQMQIINIFEPALHNYAMINKSNRRNNREMVILLQNHLSNYPNNVSLVILLSEYLFQSNEYKVAQELLNSYHKELVELKRVEAYIPSIPVIYSSQAEIDNFRNELNKALDIALAQDISIPENNLTLVNTYYLAYHNRNNKDILTKLSNFYTHVSPSLLYTAQHCKSYKFSNKKIKLGFISNYFTIGHPVLKFMQNILESFAKNSHYEVHIFTFSKKTPQLDNATIHLITNTINTTRVNIAKQKLDILIYPEIGMHAPTYFLAHARLAPVQCMFGGHPMTSGVKNIDYYFSQKDLEIKNAQSHYAENLILFNNFVASYSKPQAIKTYFSQENLNLNSDKHNYLIPAKLHKIHPDFDAILFELIKQDNKANIIFFKDSSEIDWDLFVQKRLLQKIPNECMTFLPWAEAKTFYSLLHHADAVLEPIVFGYGTTAIEALSIGTPIVSLPGDYPSGRIVSAFYKKINFQMLDISNTQEYIQQAIKLSTNNSFKVACKKTLLQSNHLLFKNNAIIDELDIFFQEKLVIQEIQL